MCLIWHIYSFDKLYDIHFLRLQTLPHLVVFICVKGIKLILGRTKEPLDESEKGDWKSWLKAQHSENEDHGIWSHHFMVDGETVETVSDFIFGGSQITTDGDCRYEIKRRFLLGRKLMTNLDGILKSRDITLPTKVHLVKAMVFPLVMYGCETWNIKKAEWWRIDAFELWCWRGLLRVP